MGKDYAEEGIAGRMTLDPLRGKTLRWTFHDGPTAGTTYEHAFGRNGTVAYRQVDPTGRPSKGSGHEARYEVAALREDVVAVSYLSESGFTLTCVLDFADRTIAAFASNEEELVLQRGGFEEVRRKPRSRTHRAPIRRSPMATRPRP